MTVERVSIIIPAFNAAAFIDAALWSARHQDYPSIEIIVIDDGSTDATLSIIQVHAKSDPRISVITTENRGAGAARAAGLMASAGHYVAFLDADDIWHPTKIRRQLDLLHEKSAQDPDYAAIYTLHRQIDAGDRVLSSCVDNGIDGLCFNRHMLARPVGNGSSLLVVRKVAVAANTFKACNGVDRLCEDFEFELSLAARCKIACVPEYLVGYRQHSSNLSRNALGMIQAFRQVIARHAAAANSHVVNWVLADTHLAEARFHFRARHFGRAVVALATYAVRDPRALMAEVRAVVIKRLYAPPQADHTFDSIQPSEGRLEPSRLTATRLRRLADSEQLQHPLPFAQET